MGLCAAIFLIEGCATAPKPRRSYVSASGDTTEAEEEAKRWLEAARRRLEAERQQDSDQDLEKKKSAAIRSRDAEKERRLEELRKKREEAKRNREEAEAQAEQAHEGARIVGRSGGAAVPAQESRRPQETKAAKKGKPPPEMSYRLHKGDELEISVWGHADLNRKVQIGDSGFFPFPLIGEIQAVGRSLPEVAKELQERLDRDYIVNPQVSLHSVNAKFSVLGEVARPGSYPIEGTMDLLTAISLAGGITKFGSNRADIIRGEGDEKITLRTNVDGIIQGKEPNVDILPHDTVYVRRRVF